MWQDRAADAELVLLEQRDKVARIFGSGSLEVGRLELEIANFLIKLGRGDEARPHAGRAAKIFATSPRAPPLLTVSARFLLAKTESALGRFGQAAQEQETGLRILKANLPDDHPMVLVASVDLSWMLIPLGRRAEAWELAKGAWATAWQRNSEADRDFAAHVVLLLWRIAQDEGDPSRIGPFIEPILARFNELGAPGRFMTAIVAAEIARGDPADAGKARQALERLRDLRGLEREFAERAAEARSEGGQAWQIIRGGSSLHPRRSERRLCP